MPLSAIDVADKVFTRTFPGYARNEVDAFLDDVQGELARLSRDNAELRALLEQRVAGTGPVPGQALRTLELAQRTADEAIAAATAEAESLLAAAEADARDARDEAEATRLATSAETETALTAARAEADRLETSARERAEAQEAQAASRLEELREAVEQERAALEASVAHLRAFEREYRDRLRSYLQAQLRELGATGPQRHTAGADGQAAFG